MRMEGKEMCESKDSNVCTVLRSHISCDIFTNNSCTYFSNASLNLTCNCFQFILDAQA